jgi:hypothetical protein
MDAHLAALARIDDVAKTFGPDGSEDDSLRVCI